MLRLSAFRMTMSIPVPLSYICQDLQPINEYPFQRLQGLARDLDCGVVTGVVTFSVDGVLRPALIGCTRILNASSRGVRLRTPHPPWQPKAIAFASSSEFKMDSDEPLVHPESRIHKPG